METFKELPNPLVKLIEDEYPNMAGIAVSLRGKQSYEHYFQGYIGQDPIHIASVTKSIMSILVGIAIDQGSIKSVGQKVMDFFLDYQIRKREKELPNITLEQLLTMTAPYRFKSEPYTQVYSSADWTKATLDLLGGKPLGTDSKYTTVGLHMLSAILVQATGKSVLEFATEHLFAPLGIKSPSSIHIQNREAYMAFLKDKYVSGWVRDPKGIHTPGWGLTLTTVAMLKIGQLYANGGKWKGKQLVSSDWVAASTKKHSTIKDKSYGYLWWIIREGRPSCYAAIGDGGNLIYVDEESSVVVAINSRFMPRAKDRIEFVQDILLPALF